MQVEVYQQGGSSSLDSQDLPDYDGLLVEFDRSLSPAEKDRAAGILAYWAKLPFVANGSTENQWLADNQLWIDANSINSLSSNWRNRQPFELLEKWFIEGTDQRKRDNNSRAVNGIGLAPQRVILSHPKRAIPIRRENKPKRKITKASDLLSHS